MAAEKNLIRPGVLGEDATSRRRREAVDAAIARIDKEVDSQVEPFRLAVEILSAIPGLSEEVQNAGGSHSRRRFAEPSDMRQGDKVALAFDWHWEVGLPRVSVGMEQSSAEFAR